VEGEREIITVLFADMKGSLELIAEQDPEAARVALDEVRERMKEAVHQCEGIVSEARGDGIMALSGAPLAHEDHALRACDAALRMQGSVGKLSWQRQRDGLPAVAIRVGLSSGEVVVRSIGSDLRMDYSAVGTTTHVAARMERLAEPGKILLTESTRWMAEGFVEIAELGVKAVKGLTQPLPIFHLPGATSARTRLQPQSGRDGHAGRRACRRRPTRLRETLAISPTAEAVLAARIDRLSAEDKRLLQRRLSSASRLRCRSW
jgi:class 3 adenylate cyclase